MTVCGEGGDDVVRGHRVDGGLGDQLSLAREPGQEAAGVGAGQPQAGDRAFDRVVRDVVVTGVPGQAGQRADEPRGPRRQGGLDDLHHPRAERDRLDEGVEAALGVVGRGRERLHVRLRQLGEGQLVHHDVTGPGVGRRGDARPQAGGRRGERQRQAGERGAVVEAEQAGAGPPARHLDRFERDVQAELREPLGQPSLGPRVRRVAGAADAALHDGLDPAEHLGGGRHVLHGHDPTIDRTRL
ncbi:hypothetical protein [Nonomuraea fuscirosea]|uniref:hypothetical protein n=1 Tax=Nonomuraea fuscirosea TaxID=1291556 RepID=UPI001C63434E|nr:hypothetical protein [Nonomuraea fuscirosea]